MTLRNSQTYDNLTLLKDAGAITATAAALVGGVARVLDLGSGGRLEAKAVIETSAIDFTTGDESYRVTLEGCNDIAFGSGIVELGSLAIVTAAPGRQEIYFVNEADNTIYQYARLKHTIGGTTPSINYVAFLAKIN